MNQKAGFTLIELSIVLVIISLIVSGVVSSRSLIEQSEIRGLVKRMEQFQVAFQGFKEKYKYYPGDMPDATAVWGAATGNGNGDERIVYPTTGTGNNEGLRAWQQLGEAGFIQGRYTGEGTTDQEAMPGENVPDLRFSNLLGVYVHHEGWLLNDAVNLMIIGGYNEGTWNNEAGLTVVQAGGIDNKIDDGFPSRGRVWAQGGQKGASLSVDCTSGTGAAAIYQLENESRECLLAIKID